MSKLLPIFAVGLLIVISIAALFAIKSGRDLKREKHQIVSMRNDAQEAIKTVNIGGKAEFKVGLAVTREQRAKGLSGREYLADDEGLLFVFQNPGRHGFWMKDMNFAIDIIWVDEEKKVVDIRENANPESYPAETFYPSYPALYVLEINAGLVEKYGIKVGDSVLMI